MGRVNAFCWSALVGSAYHPPGDYNRRQVPTAHLQLGWRTRGEAETLLSGNSLVRSGLAWAEGMRSLQDPPSSLPQTQPGAGSTTTPSCLPVSCTVLTPALSRLWKDANTSRAAFHATGAADAYEMSTALSRNCQSCVTGLLHRAQALFSEDRGQPCGSFPELPRALSCIPQQDEHVHAITEAGRLLSSSWRCDRQGLFERQCVIIPCINRTNPSLPWARSCCFTRVAKRTKNRITSLSLSEPPSLTVQPRACIRKDWTSN